MAKWFHEIYKVVGPAEALLGKYANSELLKTVMIESFMPDDVRSVISDLVPENIRDKIEKGREIKVVAEEVKENIIRLYSALEPATAKRILKSVNFSMDYLASLT